MNLEHLKAFFWLRYRLRVNQLKRAGALNFAIMVFIVWAAIVLSGILLFAGFFVGLFALPQAPSWVKLLVWDGIVLAMLFSWMIGLMTDLQRSDGLALDKFLHLPVSPVGAFLINYLSSLFSLTLIVFLPGMIGLILGQVFGETPAMLLALPLLASFVLALTALTYQFQGWLATLMSNPRKRRTVIVLVTLSFVAMAQLPQLVHLFVPKQVAKSNESYKKESEERGEVLKAATEGKIKPDESKQRMEEITKRYSDQRKSSDQEELETIEQTGRVLNSVLPPGSFALGTADLASNSFLPALLGMAGLTLIGAYSLRRAYRTTLRIFTGSIGTGSSSSAAATTPADPTKVRLVEWRLPWVSEQASGVATAAFRSLLRAPESKMTLIVPVILMIVFGSIAISVPEPPPAAARPMIPFGACALVLLASIQIAGNQFGYDRSGFRAYVLCPAPRHDILIGKNLALVPLTLGLCLVMCTIVECVFPMRVDLYLATLVQAVTMYILFSPLANLVSILAPMPMAAGSLQASGVKLVPVLIQMLVSMIGYPIILLPTLIPYGIELLLSELDVVRGVPIALPLGLLVLVGAIAIYRVLLRWEGQLLAKREQAVLTIVVSKAE